MDFLIGILLVVIALLIIINFTTISISDTKFGSSGYNTCAPSNYLISTMQSMPLNNMGSGPSPQNANAKFALGDKELLFLKTFC